MLQSTPSTNSLLVDPAGALPNDQLTSSPDGLPYDPNNQVARSRIALPLITSPSGQRTVSAITPTARPAYANAGYAGVDPSGVNTATTFSATSPSAGVYYPAASYPAAYSGQPAHIRPDEKRSFRGLAITLTCLVALLIAVYFGCAFFFKSHFAFNTYIDNVNCTFMTPDQVNVIISEQLKDYQLEVKGREGVHDIISGSAVGLVYVPDHQTRAILESQDFFRWPLYLFERPEARYTYPSVEVNELRFADRIGGLACLDTKQMRAPVDAYIEFAHPGYEIIPEDLGTTVDRSLAHAAIREAMLVTAPLVDLDEAGCYVLPDLFSDSPELAEIIDNYNTYVPFSITYLFGETTIILEASTTINWVTIGVTEPGTLDYNAVVAWVDALADRYDTLGLQRTFLNGFGEEKTVSGGTYGWRIDRRAEVSAIINACRTGSNEVREVYCTSRAASFDGPDWGGTYAEVDITEQYMWYYENGELVMHCHVVTGQPDGYNDTPTGVYFIWDKKSPTVLIGSPDPVTGEPIYRSPVDYWMAITYGGVGFHDASWQDWFGYPRYLYAGSHGCINMPYYDAQYLYSRIAMGCPVVMHF